MVPPIAIVFVLFCLGLAGCATPGAQAIKNCEVNSLPQTEQGAIACAASAATAGGDVQAALTACATSLVPAQFNCLVQGLVTWFKGRVPSHGQVDALTLAAVEHLQVYLNSHGGSSCNDSDVNHVLQKIDRRMAYASVNR